MSEDYIEKDGKKYDKKTGERIIKQDGKTYAKIGLVDGFLIRIG
ncbi:MAG: hypothetical protein AB1466_01205 [Actinomycetota bacterium]